MNAKHVQTRAQKIALVLGTGIVLIVAFFFLFAGARRSELQSFVVDLKRANVPHATPDPSPTVDPPVAFGLVRFNELQELVDWKIQDSFRDAYPGQVADMRFHGPLADNETVAPVLFAMGLQTQSNANVLIGSSVINTDTFAVIKIDWSRFYVALYLKNGGTHIEVARSRLIRSKKQ